MLINIWRLFLGYIEFDIIGKFPERFLNIAYKSGINIWGQMPKKDVITATMLLKDYKTIRPIARKARVKLKIKHKYGMPFYIQKNSDRKGLLIGLALSVIMIIFLSNYIWVININTTQNLNYITLKDTLAQNGVTVGTPKSKIDVLALERKIMEQTPELSWVATNIEGTTLTLEVKQGEIKPNLDKSKEPADIVAKKDGVILKLDVKNGDTKTEVGSGVVEGQTLVSGIMTDSEGNIRKTVHSSASIIAKTYQTYDFYVSKNFSIYVPTGEVFNRYKFNLLRLTSPNTPILLDNAIYCKVLNTYNAEVNQRIIPFGVTVERNYKYSQLNKTLTDTEQTEALYKKLALFEGFCMSKSTILERNITQNTDKEGTKFTVEYICNEDIAVTSPIQP